MFYDRRVKFLGLLFAVAVGRVLLTLDVPIQAVQAEHDFLLYVRGAYGLMTSGDLGPWTTYTLTKLPGFPFLLAWTRMAGLTYPAFVLISLVALGALWVWALRGAGVPQRAQAFVFGAVLFHPVTYELGFQVTRERTSHMVFLALVALLVRMASRIRQGRVEWGSAVAFALLFAGGRLLREEDFQLYWVFLGVAFTALSVVAGGAGAHGRRRAMVGVAAVCVVSLGLAWASEHRLREFVNGRYGAPLLHELSEGEFPRLLAAFRSIQPQANRHVMIPLAAVERVGDLWPPFASVRSGIPDTGLFSCWRFQICDEWTNGWMVFWIKDGWVKASGARDLMSAQAAYRELRERIQGFCSTGELTCEASGDGLLRPLGLSGLRWWPAWVLEFSRTWHQVLFPRVKVNTSRQYHIAPADAGAVEAYRFVTGAEVYASEDLQESSLGRMVRMAWIYVVVVLGGLSLVGFGVYGLRRGRWHAMLRPVQTLRVASPLGVAAMIVAVYCVLRNVSLAGVAVTMGWLDDRLYAGFHWVACVLMAAVLGSALNRSGRV